MLKRLLLALSVIVLSMGAVNAETSDRDALIETVSTFKTAMSVGDFDTVMSMVPEKVFGQMAEDLDVSPDYLMVLVVEQMKSVLTEVKIVAFEMQTSNFEVEETTTGIPYVFLPTRTVVDVQGAKVETKSHTLALRDGKDWRLVRIDDAGQLKVLRKVYPGFSEIDFPRNSVRLLN